MTETYVSCFKPVDICTTFAVSGRITHRNNESIWSPLRCGDLGLRARPRPSRPSRVCAYTHNSVLQIAITNAESIQKKEYPFMNSRTSMIFAALHALCAIASFAYSGLPITKSSQILNVGHPSLYIIQHQCPNWTCIILLSLTCGSYLTLLQPTSRAPWSVVRPPHWAKNTSKPAVISPPRRRRRSILSVRP